MEQADASFAGVGQVGIGQAGVGKADGEKLGKK